MEKRTDILVALGELGAGAVIYVEGLAALSGKHVMSVKRAIQRGELPQPVKFLGRFGWTVGVIIQHLEARLATESKERQVAESKISRLSP